MLFSFSSRLHCVVLLRCFLPVPRCLFTLRGGDASVRPDWFTAPQPKVRGSWSFWWTPLVTQVPAKRIAYFFMLLVQGQAAVGPTDKIIMRFQRMTRKVPLLRMKKCLVEKKVQNLIILSTRAKLNSFSTHFFMNQANLKLGLKWDWMYCRTSLRIGF